MNECEEEIENERMKKEMGDESDDLFPSLAHSEIALENFHFYSFVMKPIDYCPFIIIEKSKDDEKIRAREMKYFLSHVMIIHNVLM